MPTQVNRFQPQEEESNKVRQLSSLFNIISNNLLLASEILGSDYNGTVKELESFSHKAKKLASQLLANDSEVKSEIKEDINENISFLKQRMLTLVLNINEELSKIDPSKHSDKKSLEDIIIVRRLLREAHRGLITLQD